MSEEALDDPSTAAILSAAFAVHNGLGPGFEELFYQRRWHSNLRRASWSSMGCCGH